MIQHFSWTILSHLVGPKLKIIGFWESWTRPPGPEIITIMTCRFFKSEIEKLLVQHVVCSMLNILEYSHHSGASIHPHHFRCPKSIHSHHLGPSGYNPEPQNHLCLTLDLQDYSTPQPSLPPTLLAVCSSPQPFPTPPLLAFYLPTTPRPIQIPTPALLILFSVNSYYFRLINGLIG